MSRAMSEVSHQVWDRRHQDKTAGEPEPFVVEMLPLLRRGLALDVAAGRGRHSLALARAGFSVVAVDYSAVGIAKLAGAARRERLPIRCVVGDLTACPLRPAGFDLILNVNFLDRSLIPRFKHELEPGGALLVDTFLVDQAGLGHPSDPRHLLGHWELRDLLAGLKLARYREGLTVYADGTRAWRASALALRRS